MAKEEAKLRKDLLELMIQKFGKKVDIDEMEEVQLRRMVLDLRLSRLDLKSLYEHELKLWKGTYENKQIQLASLIKQNTEKFELLTVMNREKLEFTHLVETQQYKKQHFDDVVDAATFYRKDIQKLSEIVKKQRKEIQVGSSLVK